jgi:hypothetical protein
VAALPEQFSEGVVPPRVDRLLQNGPLFQKPSESILF